MHRTLRPRRFAVSLAALTLAFAAIAGSASASPGALKILIAESQCDSMTPAFNLQTSIAAQPGVASVEFFDTSSGSGSTPTAAQLAAYDAVVAMGDCNWHNPTAFGDALADYQDQGGAVIGATFSWQSGTSAFGGRWMSGGYTPFTMSVTSVFGDSTLASADTAHPLMQGVNSLQAHYLETVALTPGAVQLATWQTGPIAVAVKGNALGINAYVGNGYAEPVLGDFGRLIVNAANQLGRHTITVAKSGTGSGTITGTVGGISCGAVCSATVINGTVVGLKVKPSRGQIFTGWSGGGCSGVLECSYVPSGNDTIFANFVKHPMVFGKVSSKNGTATIKVKFAAKGKLIVSGNGLKKLTKTIKKAGTVKLKLKTKSGGAATIKAKFAFRATGNSTVTKTKKIKFKS